MSIASGGRAEMLCAKRFQHHSAGLASMTDTVFVDFGQLRSTFAPWHPEQGVITKPPSPFGSVKISPCHLPVAMSGVGSLADRMNTMQQKNKHFDPCEAPAR